MCLPDESKKYQSKDEVTNLQTFVLNTNQIATPVEHITICDNIALSLNLCLNGCSCFQVLLDAARVRLVKERKMHAVIREIVFFFMFVWVVLLIAYGHRDPYAHFMTQNMENTFVGHQESLGPREEDKISTKKPAGDNDGIKLYDVST